MIQIFLVACCGHLVFGQNLLVHYGMDCSYEDLTGNFSQFFVSEVVDCDCGVLDEAIIISGKEQYIDIDTLLSFIFLDDYGISFYFRYDGNDELIELMSVGSNCSSDSTMRIYYEKSKGLVSWETSQSISKKTTLTGKINTNKCWHHVAVSRKDNFYELYLDGLLAASNLEDDFYYIAQTLPIKIGNGACVGVISNKFKGMIDDLKIFNSAIPSFYIQQNYLPYEEIITKDTTIFEGSTLEIEAYNHCSEQIMWTPSDDIDDPNAFVTYLDANQTTRLTATFDTKTCIATDTVLITVIDPEDVKCEDILFPNVFTPNGDGLNDNFGIVNPFIVSELEYFEIFDRWGEKLFYTEDKHERWDGSFRNKDLHSNMFLYKVKYTCNETSYIKTGSFSIFR